MTAVLSLCIFATALLVNNDKVKASLLGKSPPKNKGDLKILKKVCYEVSLYLEKKESQIKEAHLKRSAERIDRLSILGEITAGIAHELNTPLGNILGFAELIKQQNNNPQIDRDISKIINAAIYSREIVKNLMFFSCEMPQNKSVFPVKPIIMQALT